MFRPGEFMRDEWPQAMSCNLRLTYPNKRPPDRDCLDACLWKSLYLAIGRMATASDNVPSSDFSSLRQLASLACAAGSQRSRESETESMIADDVKLGLDVVIYHPHLVNLYGCEIGDGCKIGAFVEIRRMAKI